MVVKNCHTQSADYEHEHKDLFCYVSHSRHQICFKSTPIKLSPVVLVRESVAWHRNCKLTDSATECGKCNRNSISSQFTVNGQVLDGRGRDLHKYFCKNPDRSHRITDHEPEMPLCHSKEHHQHNLHFILLYSSDVIGIHLIDVFITFGTFLLNVIHIELIE